MLTFFSHYAVTQSSNITLCLVHVYVLLKTGFDLFCVRFIGEESSAAGVKCELTDSPTWIIDPIDGTCNFVHRYAMHLHSITCVLVIRV